jgi:ASPIC/UnbV protein/PPIC-type peptidyl-prolyl cis-trans isomerase-like protein/VCBS repeat protein
MQTTVLKLLIALLTAIICLSICPAQDSSLPAAPGVRIIVVPSSSKAQEILDALKQGKDFAELAQAKSSDPTSTNGGYMGRPQPGTLCTELKDALEGVAPGQVTGIVQVPAGYAILKVLPESEVPRQNVNSAPLPFATAACALHTTILVSGFGEAMTIYREFPKSDGWNRDLHQICAISKVSVPITLDRLDEALIPGSPQTMRAEPLDLMQAHYASAGLHAYQGEMQKAMAQWLSAKQIAKTSVPNALPMMEETLGIAYLHKSEMENGEYRNPGDRCLFPPHLGVPYPAFLKKEDSEKAIQYLLQYLASKPDDLDVKWLLNLSYMTLGQYPKGVPSKYLLPPSIFESKENIGRFVDVASAAGLKVFSEAGGVIVDDFENNGLLDVVMSTKDYCQSLRYFHNNGDGTFTERTEQAGLQNILGGLNMVQADYNNDGCMDILVLRGGWEFPMRKSLLRNNCDGTFTDVTEKSGLAASVTATQTAVWADIDNDGFVDLFIGNENGPSQLFRNKGDGTFEDISHAAGVDKVAFTKGVVAADYDQDGYMDFYVTNYFGGNFLYHNNHDRTFTEVGKQAGVQEPQRSFAAWWFDYNNDGWPDLYVSTYYGSVEEVLRTYLGQPHTVETMKIYKNLGNGTFEDATKEVGLDKVFMPMGSNFGDVNNDGYPDIYLGSGNTSFAGLLPHVLLLNKEGKSFVDITASSGTGELHKGHGIAFADLARDGNEDIIAQIGGAVPSDAHALRVFKNPGSGNDWINVRLIGVKTNRAAIGARIKVTVQDQGRPERAVYRTVSSGGSFGANPLEQHIGLGKSAKISNVEVWWPTSNTRQNFSNVASNQFIEVKEFASDYTQLHRKAAHLGGPEKAPAKAPVAVAGKLASPPVGTGQHARQP